MSNYNFEQIEKKIRDKWEKDGIYHTDLKKADNKFYNLMMFPYPSGDKLHIGHVYNYSGADAFGRYIKMNGKNVFEPMGYDAFGLPAENYAIKKGVNPAISTKENVDYMREQLKALGCMYDWPREINTSDPNYYKWTQWLFLTLYKAGLAKRKKAPVNWCPSCKTVLANEQVVNGACERCGTEVVQKNLKQWFFEITKYADRLLEDLSKINWPKRTKLMQENWIGKSEGLEEKWQVDGMDLKLKTFTTWPHTSWGSTFMVIAPEHPMIEKLVEGTKYEKDAKNFASKTIAEKIRDPKNVEKNKEGFFIGRYVINHLTNKKIPLYIANFAIYDYGTGIVKCTPAHDQRDFEFAKKYDLEIKPVIDPQDKNKLDPTNMTKAYTGEGVMINAGEFDGMPTQKARKAIGDFTVKKGNGKWSVNYHLRDWLISRQRYWGAPIPIIFCKNCAHKPKVLLAHGITGHNKENWFPWAKTELENRGYEVIIPNLPDTDYPDLNKWVESLKKEIKDDDHLILVGHSLGAPAICQLIIRNNIKIDKLILVAPTGPSQKDSNFKTLLDVGLDQKEIDIIKSFNESNSDLAKLKHLAKERIIYLSDNDPYIPLEIEKNYADINAEVTILHKKGHFNHAAGITQFPEILKEFPKVESSTEVPVDEKDLPVELPEINDFKPTEDGQSPLAKLPNFVNIRCPKCGGEAKRSTETMDTFVCSSWYFLRYLSPKITDQPFDKELAKSWLPVDQYCGGAEHSVMHLLYARFITKVLHDQKLIEFDEPFSKLNHQGIITAEDGSKMSKSRGNVVIPDEYFKKYGVDTFRLFILFLAPFEQGGSWSDKGILGAKRFLDRIWAFQENLSDNNPSEDSLRVAHQTIKKVSDDYKDFHFNTAIASLMEYLNYLQKEKEKSHELYETLIKLLAPICPYIAEEIWEKMGNKESIFVSSWPKYDEKLAKAETITIAIQVNGKLRGTIETAADAPETEVKKLALENEKIKNLITEKEIQKTIYVPGRIINFVIK